MGVVIQMPTTGQPFTSVTTIGHHKLTLTFRPNKPVNRRWAWHLEMNFQGIRTQAGGVSESRGEANVDAVKMLGRFEKVIDVTSR